MKVSTLVWIILAVILAIFDIKLITSEFNSQPDLIQLAEIMSLLITVCFAVVFSVAFIYEYKDYKIEPKKIANFIKKLLK